MAKRIRRVFRNAGEVAHVWAQRTQDEGHSANCFFEGDSIYSYGRHFEIARHVNAPNGQNVVLLTTRGYSRTTEGHKGVVETAVRHLNMFHVAVFDNPSLQLEDYQSRIDKIMGQAAKSRKYAEGYLRTAQGLLTEANHFAEVFGLTRRLALPGLDAVKDRIRKQAADARAAEKARKETLDKLRELVPAALEAWRNGADKYEFRHLREVMPEYDVCRIASNGTDIETLRGAYVPIDHAERAYRLIQRARTNGVPPSDIRIGHYTLSGIQNWTDSPSTWVVNIGCHRIPWYEVERLAARLGWTTRPAVAV